jgi:hypothetical protein
MTGSQPAMIVPSWVPHIHDPAYCLCTVLGDKPEVGVH